MIYSDDLGKEEDERPLSSETPHLRPLSINFLFSFLPAIAADAAVTAAGAAAVAAAAFSPRSGKSIFLRAEETVFFPRAITIKRERPIF